MEYIPQEIPENINVTPIHPLKYFAKVGMMILLGLTVLYLLSGLIAAQLTRVIDPNVEAAIGESLVLSLTTEPIRPQQTQYLQTLLDELQEISQTRQPKAQIHILDRPEINAGALPGGQMIMTTALIDAAQSENELAFVLGHELGHHQFRHPSQGLGRSLLWMTTLSLLGLGQSSIDPSAPLALANVQFNRAQEVVSDEFALDLIQRRYGHVDHSLDFFRRLQQQNFDALAPQLEFFSTHPFPATRIEDLEDYAKRQGWRLDGELTPIAELL